MVEGRLVEALLGEVAVLGVAALTTKSVEGIEVVVGDDVAEHVARVLADDPMSPVALLRAVASGAHVRGDRLPRRDVAAGDDERRGGGLTLSNRLSGCPRLVDAVAGRATCTP